MPIPVHCPSCQARFTAPDHFAGKNANCPKCQAPFTISAVAGSATTLPPAREIVIPSPPSAPLAVAQTVRPLITAAPQREVKNCPFCSEEILATAAKCKHCGELLDPALRMSAQRSVPVIVQTNVNTFSAGMKWIKLVGGVSCIGGSTLLAIAFASGGSSALGAIGFLAAVVGFVLFVIGRMFDG